MHAHGYDRRRMMNSKRYCDLHVLDTSWQFKKDNVMSSSYIWIFSMQFNSSRKFTCECVPEIYGENKIKCFYLDFLSSIF